MGYRLRRRRSYLSSKALDTRQKLRHIGTLVQVDCLTEVRLRYAVILTERQEHLNVLHLQIHTRQVSVTGSVIHIHTGHNVTWHNQTSTKVGLPVIKSYCRRDIRERLTYTLSSFS